MIRNRLIVAYLLPTVLLLVVGGIVIYLYARTSLEEELGRRLISVAETAAGSLPSGEPRRIAKLTGDDSATIERLRKKLVSVRDATRVRRVFLCDPQLRSLVDTRQDVAFGDELFELQADRVEMDRVFAGEGQSTSSVMFSGKDGVDYKNGYAPILYEGRVVAALGVEGSAEFFETLDDFGSLLIGTVLLGLLIIVGASFLVARSITSPIDDLTTAAGRFGRGDLTTPIAMSRQDEFQTLANAFNEMRQNLLDRDQQLQMMLAGIAHEVRNPLGGMELFCGLLSEEVDPQSTEGEYVQKVKKELSYLKRVVNDFLDYARRQPLEWDRVVALQYLDEVVNLLMWDLEGQGVGLKRRDMSEDVELTLDKERLRRVLINVIRNAGQASGEGTTVEIWAGEVAGVAAEDIPELADYDATIRPTKSAPQSDHWRAIYIADQGAGIPDKKLEEIFTPFYTTKEKGSGLGLALAAKTVEEHGGCMWVASSTADEGSGTLMVVILPLKPDIERESMVIPEGWLG